MRFADYLADRLLRAGMTRVFLVTGGGSMHLNDAFARNGGLQVSCFHHEQAAAIAAEGFARLSGAPCVVNVTTGPGGINALVGVFGAYVDSVPMFVVSGQVKLATCMGSFPDLALRQLGDQEAPIAALVKSVVKYVCSVRTVSEAVIAVERALFLMLSGRPGPVWLDVPVDIQGELVDVGKLDQLADSVHGTEFLRRLREDTGCHPNTLLELTAKLKQSERPLQDQVNDVYQRLFEAVRPVILVGTGVHSPGARAALSVLVDSLEMPVVTGWNALDLIPSSHPNFAGRPGTVGDRIGNFVVQSADFILVIGCRLNIRQISYNWKSFGKNAFIVMVDIDTAELEKPTLNVGLKIHASAEDFLTCLVNTVDKPIPHAHRNFLQRARELYSQHPIQQPHLMEDHLLDPYAFLRRLTNILPEGATVVTGNGAACVMTFQVAEVKPFQRYITNSGCASMGYDLPAAIGAAIATTNRDPVICIAGDGSIMMNLQELQTVKTLNLNLKIIILNNGGYLSIRQTQKSYFSDNQFGTGGGNGLDIPSFRKLAAAFEIEYMEILKYSDMEKIDFTGNFKSDKPVIIEVFVDPEQYFSPKLASRIEEDGSMSSPELDDMAPFLDREVLRSTRISLTG